MATPPGLWQAGGGAPGNGEAPGREAELQKEISSTIEAQVARLIEQARIDTESKVKVELGAIRKHMMDMDARLDQLIASLDSMEPQESAETAMDPETVGQLLSKVEQTWGQEIRTLKQELHQTILAHNHNADLIKHHKDTIDQLRDRAAKLQGNVKTVEIQQQLQRIDQRLKQQQKQRKLEPLFDRLQVLENRVANAWRSAAYPSDPGLPPGMGMPPGISQSAMPPGIGVPPGMKGAGAKAKAQPKAKAGAEKGAKYPTDEELQARLKTVADAASPPAEAPPPPPAGLEEAAPEEQASEPAA